jgi:hypothetical protein
MLRYLLVHATSSSLLQAVSSLGYAASKFSYKMSDYIPRFDLNLLASQDDDADADGVLDLDEQQDDDANDVFNHDETEDHHSGNASLRSCPCLFIIVSFFFTVLDLNLPLSTATVVIIVYFLQYLT